MRHASTSLWLALSLVALAATPAAAQSATPEVGPLGGGLTGSAVPPKGQTVSVQITPASALALDAASIGLSNRLAAGTMTGPGGVTIPSGVQALLLRVLSTGDAAAGTMLRDALARRADAESAAALAEALEYLLTDRAVGQLQEAVLHYDRMLASSGSAARPDRPAELVAVHAVLAELVRAAGMTP